MVSGQLPPEKNCPLVRLEFGSRLGLVLGLGGNQTVTPWKIVHQLGLGVGLGLVLGLGGGQFSSGAIVLEPYFMYSKDVSEHC